MSTSKEWIEETPEFKSAKAHKLRAIESSDSNLEQLKKV